MQRACARVHYIHTHSAAHRRHATPAAHHTTSRPLAPVPPRTLPHITSVRLYDLRVFAICDPPPFVFASVIILLSSISKLMPSKKGIHLTLTNPTKLKTNQNNPKQILTKTNSQNPPISLYTPRRAWYTWHVTYNSNPPGSRAGRPGEQP